MAEGPAPNPSGPHTQSASTILQRPCGEQAAALRPPVALGGRAWTAEAERLLGDGSRSLTAPGSLLGTAGGPDGGCAVTLPGQVGLSSLKGSRHRESQGSLGCPLLQERQLRLLLRPHWPLGLDVRPLACPAVSSHHPRWCSRPPGSAEPPGTWPRNQRGVGPSTPASASTDPSELSSWGCCGARRAGF